MPTVGVITPVKDEADNLPTLIESVENQTLRPECWVIVDDGSTDGSTAIIEDAASEHSWIRHCRKADSETYDIGVNYARVLAAGYAELTERYGEELDYYMVLDGDMELSEGYLDAVASYLDARDDVVIACASVYTRTAAGLELAEHAKEHPLGGATLYDGDFYREIDGPPATPCVDSVTKAKAHMRGYVPRYATELDERAIQARPAHENGDPLENARNLGRNNYVIGYHPLAAVARGGHVLLESSVLQGLSYLRGYFAAWTSKAPRLADDDVVRYYYRQKPRNIVKEIRSRIDDSVGG